MQKVHRWGNTYNNWCTQVSILHLGWSVKIKELFNWLDMRGGKIRTTRTPAFWDTVPWLPILVIHIRSQVKTRQSQSYKFKKIAKNPNVEILQETLHATHFLKLLDKMSKYEMDPTRTVGSTEWTRNAGRTDGRTNVLTDGQTDGVKPIYPPTTFLCGGYDNISARNPFYWGDRNIMENTLVWAGIYVSWDQYQ